MSSMHPQVLYQACIRCMDRQKNEPAELRNLLNQINNHLRNSKSCFEVEAAVLNYVVSKTEILEDSGSKY
jgi:hypothetical protein